MKFHCANCSISPTLKLPPEPGYNSYTDIKETMKVYCANCSIHPTLKLPAPPLLTPGYPPNLFGKSWYPQPFKF